MRDNERKNRNHKHHSPPIGRSILSLLLTIGSLVILPSPAGAEFPSGWPWKITHLVYPTLGQPVIIKQGETFTIEFDCIGKGEGTNQPAVSEWTATLSSSNDRWPTEMACPIESSTNGISERWPGDSTVDYWKGSGPWAGKEVWKVTVRVPSDTRPDLYDLLVTAEGAAWVSDSQPHAVRVVDGYKDEYTFIQITDFHINDPRGPASWVALPEPHPDSEEFRDYAYNLKAIDDVNRLNPDFVIMSGDTVFGIPFFVEFPWESTGITDFCGTAPDWNGEYNKTYEQILRLDVPIVCLPGNHDTYNMEIYNILVSDWTGLEGHVKQDGAEIWPTVFSPRYFGWEYGDKVHFTCIWTYDKHAREFNPLEQNTRNFLSGAWIFPEAELPQNLLAGGRVQADQMDWIARDLQEAGGNYDLLAMASHHPFFGEYGEGDSFDDQTNRDELIALSHQTGVRLAVSGHTHVDNFFEDTSGPEEIIHLNTTSTTFSTREYPGFRPITIRDGHPVTYYYRFNSQTECLSYPVYKDTILKKHADPVAAWNDLTRLSTPSVEGWFSSTAPSAVSKSFTCRNYLTEGDPAVTISGTVIDFLMPDLESPDNYQVTGGTLLRYWNPISGYITFQVLIDPVGPGGETVTTVGASVSPEDQPIIQSGDYTGDGRSDIAVFRPSSGLWAVRDLGRVYYGAGGDIPASGDYNGDGYSEIALFRPAAGLWAVSGFTRVYFGQNGDIAAPADYDGDGTCDPAVFRPSSGLWAVRDFTRAYFGTAGDRPVPADYDGYGGDDIALFRPSTGLWAIRGISRAYFGGPGDVPIPGVYRWQSPSSPRSTPALRSQIAVFRPATGLWAIKGVTRTYFGQANDVPLRGDFTGNALDDITIFRGDSGLWAIRGVTRAYFGRPGDVPVTR